MATDFANLAAAITAGYKQTTTDRGAAFSPASERWKVTLSKPIVGEPGYSGGEFRSEGYGSSQANAETVALNALHTQRKLRYSYGSANSGKGAGGGSLNDDVS
jgi:hypothetical protein